MKSNQITLSLLRDVFWLCHCPCGSSSNVGTKGFHHQPDSPSQGDSKCLQERVSLWEPGLVCSEASPSYFCWATLWLLFTQLKCGYVSSENRNNAGISSPGQEGSTGSSSTKGHWFVGTCTTGTEFLLDSCLLHKVQELFRKKPRNFFLTRIILTSLHLNSKLSESNCTICFIFELFHKEAMIVLFHNLKPR